MINFDSIWNAFLPIIKFMLGLWDFINTGVYDAFYELWSSVNPLHDLFKPIYDFLYVNTGVAEFLNQFTILEMTLGGGLAVVLILAIIGFFTDKIGL